MKFCKNCGIQITEEVSFCPQCQTPTNSQTANFKSQIKSKRTDFKNKTNKLNVAIIIILTINIILSGTNTYLIIFNDNSSNKTETTEPSNEIIITDTDSSCPASEYGNHDWSTATCEKSAFCYECGAQKEELGNHSWWTPEDREKECRYCGLPYEDYVTQDG